MKVKNCVKLVICYRLNDECGKIAGEESQEY
jgi:hypothetical protein